MVLLLSIIHIVSLIIDELGSVVTSAACIASRCYSAALAREAASLVLDIVAWTAGIVSG